MRTRYAYGVMIRYIGPVITPALFAFFIAAFVLAIVMPSWILAVSLAAGVGILAWLNGRYGNA